ncbi:hypothetical protein [Sphingomonas bisphenolicum]|uniref:Uncharacterized protein n=1 Tax=Sphingomonas bisphenolicum TaxID=296544 RepID=A0ABM7G876_9SPHN|nr:hypothetical protein [Sphingomonas bisphenolicum]BBF71065.1 hypothetical protein SBA_ch1_32650 [Sphingomonas bisphenolicum]
MSIYRRHEVLPEWEPIPYTLTGAEADEQELGFHERALKAIDWTRLPWKRFPSEGIFGKDKEWFEFVDAEFYAVVDGEDLILIQNIWHGFPDPPEWGLATKPMGQDVAWSRWGHFPDLPASWRVPK